MKCFNCLKSPADGTNLYRQNAKGEIGIWACAAHSIPVEDELVKLVAALQQCNRPPENDTTGELK
jgi:hypothetical protein